MAKVPATLREMLLMRLDVLTSKSKRAMSMFLSAASANGSRER
jgi:hypothetical protein